MKSIESIEGKPTAITGVTLIDGNGGPPVEQGYLVFQGCRIIEVGSGILPEKYRGICQIERTGETLLPGFIDCHVHFFTTVPDVELQEFMRQPPSWQYYYAAKNAEKKLKSGVTYVRDCGAQMTRNIELRDAIKKGIVNGPDIVALGRPLTITGGHGSVNGLAADGEDAVRQASRQVIRDGVNQLKVMASGGMLSLQTDPNSYQLTLKELNVVVEEATRVGKIVVAHAIGKPGIMNALEAGCLSIEHGVCLDDEAIEKMLEKDAYLVPTLTASYNIFHCSGGYATDAHRKRAEYFSDLHFQAFRKALAAGVKIAMGTDSGTPGNFHENWHQELAFYVSNGMKPMDAILSGTRVAAKLLEIDSHYGTLEEGKVADFVLVKGNPLEDITCLAHISDVYKNGVKIKK